MNRQHCLILLVYISFFNASFAQKQEVKFLFVGDAMQHLPQIESARTANGTYAYDSCFYLLKNKIKNADIACVNFETTLGEKPYRGYPMFSSPDEFAFSLQNSGFDVFFLANNHILDRHKKGLERTISILDSMSVKSTGAFKSPQQRALRYPLMIIKNGIRIAFLNYTYGMNGLKPTTPNIVNVTDTIQIKRDIRMAKFYRPHIIIANMHWGEEYHTSASKTQKRLADMLIRNGVKIIIGNHPHVVQPIVVNRENDTIQSVVYYSLGNFISNQQQPNTDGGMIAEIVISKQPNEDAATIDSCNYSLVWVRKFSEAKQLKYRLIPVSEKTITISPPLTDEETKLINLFIKNSEKIVGKINSNIP